MKPLVVNVAELLRRPGTDKPLAVQVAVAELGIDDTRVAPDALVAVEVKLESLSDGIVVTGHVRAPWHDTCRRCLIPLEGVADAVVDEIYQQRVLTDEAFPIEFDQIDLAPMARELVVLELPLAPLCRDDCRGICPTCGALHNEQDCSCEEPLVEGRWSALDALREQLN